MGMDEQQQRRFAAFSCPLAVVVRQRRCSWILRCVSVCVCLCVCVSVCVLFFRGKRMVADGSSHLETGR